MCVSATSVKWGPAGNWGAAAPAAPPPPPVAPALIAFKFLQFSKLWVQLTIEDAKKIIEIDHFFRIDI